MMSLFDDYEAEIQFAKDFPFGVPCDTWTSKQGKIKLVDMTESHIKNCMRLVGEDDDWYSVFAKELQRRKPKTNADHIRSMSDEELCDFILEKRENGTCFNDRCYVNDPNKGCDDCTMEWLKQPYKEKEE